MVNAIEAFDAKHMKPAEEIPAFRPGDTVEVNVKIKEGNNSRIQAFTGVVIARQGGGVRETFVVRKISFGTGVERRFPLHSPVIDSIKVVRKGRVRRAKLYYLRHGNGPWGIFSTCHSSVFHRFLAMRFAMRSTRVTRLVQFSG